MLHQWWKISEVCSIVNDFVDSMFDIGASFSEVTTSFRHHKYFMSQIKKNY